MNFHTKVVMVCIVALVVAMFITLLSNTASAGGVQGWSYYRELSIANKISGYQLNLSVNHDTGFADTGCGGYCKANFSDVAFFTNSGLLLPFFMTNYTTSEFAQFWVNNTYNNDTILMVFGNTSCNTTLGNGSKTFVYYNSSENDVHATELTHYGAGSFAVQTDHVFHGSYGFRGSGQSIYRLSTVDLDNKRACLYIYDEADNSDNANFLEMRNATPSLYRLFGIINDKSNSYYVCYYSPAYQHITATARTNEWHFVEIRLCNGVVTSYLDWSKNPDNQNTIYAVNQFNFGSYWSGSPDYYYNDLFFVCDYLGASSPYWSNYGSITAYSSGSESPPVGWSLCVVSLLIGLLLGLALNRKE